MRASWRYGWMSLPLAMVGLPLVMHLPHRLAQQTTLSLATVGGVMLICRLLDAVIDPLLGRWIDRWLARPRFAARAGLAMAALLLVGFALLWWLPSDQPVLWLALGLTLTYIALSALTLWQQALGVALGHTETERSRVTSWREGMALPGVILASIWMGSTLADVAIAPLAVTLLLGWWWLYGVASEHPARLRHLAQVGQATRRGSIMDVAPLFALIAPWRSAQFRGLWLTYVLSATGSAVAATVLPFYVGHYLGANDRLPVLLLIYFAGVVASLPLWLRAIGRWGLARCWSVGMAVSIAVFATVWAISPQSNQSFVAFAAVCGLTGLAAGAELACPAALLNGWIQNRPYGNPITDVRPSHQAAQAPVNEGLAFGWWTLGTKLSLALAAGLSLGLLQGLGFAPDAPAASSAETVLWVYAGLPPALKLIALAAWWWAHRHAPADTPITPSPISGTEGSSSSPI